MKSNKSHFFLIALLAASFLWMNVSSYTAEAPEQAHTDHDKVYELRTYTTHEGKLDDLNRRFADHTMALFEKHGMKNIGYWTPTDKENTLIYILAHESREAAEKSWEAFVNDPDWQKVYAASRQDGPIVENIVSVFMTSTEFSPIK
ncbi:NIPSNAP family protein [Rhodohalobacter sp. 614A]|uniref:NIPSNAP family protein n=1 Tax=Rhodohalobacter sp. 614A TaxID=2908649 RepID=UPI001F2D970E|nr:NIPSNAP family protein [Rhodohalobacter sp. 614A]